MLAISRSGEGYGLAWIDVSTGDVELQRFELELICSVMEQILPQEILVSEEMHQEKKIMQLLEEWIEKITVVSTLRFNSRNNLRRLCEFYSVNTMDAFGDFSKSEMTALGALIEYIDKDETSNTQVKMLIGKGYLKGTLSNDKYKHVPEQSTDFIFCSFPLIQPSPS